MRSVLVRTKVISEGLKDMVYLEKEKLGELTERGFTHMAPLVAYKIKVGPEGRGLLLELKINDILVLFSDKEKGDGSG